MTIKDVHIQFVFAPDSNDEPLVTMTISPGDWSKIANAVFGVERPSNMTKKIVNDITENIRWSRV